ncbi:hypothetical protein SS1G_02039 [Sclerotinia sclerotiorum 1980 UF-70]|uniref:Uncharacterized protein n=1 Tax=Sclerotinia sclerotiorum (strain ATCC 18683 / 1980 / Ss-1) TaxID=665079 RepID=A7E9Q9_SCLS1|nr:hypothetical protein SS1G_02039 [Sclerotinia sclerotiorum 1980 UF-70]EDN97111.1 hypothetical protein SS1G_02039 [Sclerotinia sclerotiorum 1980 UF-70]
MAENKSWSCDFKNQSDNTIDTDSARERQFSRKIVPGDNIRKWDTQIVILVSHENRNNLPTSLKQRKNPDSQPREYDSNKQQAMYPNCAQCTRI